MLYKKINVETIGNKIRESRKLKGMTIQDLAEKSKLTITTISNIELSVTTPTLQNLDRICKALNVNIENILY